MKKTKQTTQPRKKKHLKHTKSKTILLLILYSTPHLQTYQEEETYYEPYIQTETTIQKDEETTRHQTLQYLIKASVIILFGISIYKIIGKTLQTQPHKNTSKYVTQQNLQNALISLEKQIKEKLNTSVKTHQTPTPQPIQNLEHPIDTPTHPNKPTLNSPTPHGQNHKPRENNPQKDIILRTQTSFTQYLNKQHKKTTAKLRYLVNQEKLIQSRFPSEISLVSITSSEVTTPKPIDPLLLNDPNQISLEIVNEQTH